MDNQQKLTSTSWKNIEMCNKVYMNNILDFSQILVYSFISVTEK